MIQRNKLYIGVWDNTDQDGIESDIGGIIHGKDSFGNLKNHGLLFNIKLLNDASDAKGQLIHAYDKVIDDDFQIYPENDDKYALAESLRKYVFLFKINIDDPTNLNVYDGKKLPKYTDMSERYQAVPIIYSSDQIKNVEEFKKCLKKEEKIAYFDAGKLGNGEDSNGFVIFIDQVSSKRFLFENADLKEVGSDYLKYGLVDSTDTDNEITIRKIDDSQWSDNKYFDNDDNPSLVFIPEEDLKDGNIDFYAPKFNSLKNEQDITVSDKISRFSISETSDESIINNFVKVVKSRKYNLTFSKQDLINFHTSVKTNLLTILSGISGTGKSKIVSAYADALGINNGKQFKVISVRPFWQDDSDLLGYVDTMSNNYHPADSGLVDILLSAERNPNDLYIILLDEMNLAKIEHYFSQFLSVLEISPDDRKLRLYNTSLEPRLYNSHQYKSEIKIKNNIRFVGTMNIDESTFQMSNKLLDRANIITLNIQKFTERDLPTSGIDLNFLSKNPISMEKYQININDKKFNQNQLNFFWDLHTLVKSALPDVGIGWRTLNSIERFINNVPENNDEFDAFDYQIAQRIFPRIRGTENMISSLIHFEKKDEKTDILGGSIINLLDANQDLSSFKKCKDILKGKAREIQTYGFAR